MARAHRILSICPTSRGFGFVLFDKSVHILDWGVVTRSRHDLQYCLQRVDHLTNTYQPHCILFRVGTVLGQRARAGIFASRVKRLAARNKISYRRFSPAEVYEAFDSPAVRSKHDVACAVAARFPELAPRLPKRRKLWQSESSMMAVFQAAAGIVAACQAPKAKRSRQT